MDELQLCQPGRESAVQDNEAYQTPYPPLVDDEAMPQAGGLDRLAIESSSNRTAQTDTKKDKTTKGSHTRSALRDACAYEGRGAWAAGLPGPASGGTSVYKITTAPPLPTTTTPTKPKTRCQSWYEKLADTERRTKADFEAEGVRYPPEHRIKHHTAAPWRDLSFQGKIQELFDTMALEAGFYAITARLSPEIEARALTAHCTITCLQQRIKQRLRSFRDAGAIPEIPDVLLLLEQIYGQATHLHGAISFGPVGTSVHDPADLEIIRKAFRLGCGEWDRARQHQVHTVADPDFMWASYTLKDAVKLVPFLRKLREPSSMLTTFNGKPYSATQGILRRTRERYEFERAEFHKHKAGLRGVGR